MPHCVNHLLGHDNVVSNMSPQDKATLVFADEMREDYFDFVHHSLGYNLVHCITKANGAELTDTFRLRDLRNKDQKGIIYHSNFLFAYINTLNKVKEIVSYCFPILLEERRLKVVWT